MRTLFAPMALLPEGWQRNVEIEIDGHGNIASVQAGAVKGRSEPTGGPVIPGMINAHSHAFQRAMAGRTERRGNGDDDFWSWREWMYRFLGRIEPNHCHAIASQLYVELLKGGYTAVGEFHYIHHNPGGRPYVNLAEMAFAHLRAATDTGIAITIMPTLYGFGGVGGKPIGPAQARFATTPAQIGRMLESLHRHVVTEHDARLGIAPHSLRAVTAPTLGELIATVNTIDNTAPIHIHIAEQEREVASCIEVLGARPIEWLADHFSLSARWTLVHGTHATPAELQTVARTCALIALCPTTEANLGDGIFPLETFQSAGGRWCIGSDSHITRSAPAELQLLEYGQRLATRRRNVAADDDTPSVGESMWRRGTETGALAIGRRSGAIAPGLRADLVVLDAEVAELVGVSLPELLDTFVFSGGERLIKHVAVSGRWVIRDRQHRDEQMIATRFRKAMRNLLA
jgi:formimidoylglutamate deiminase